MSPHRSSSLLLFAFIRTLRRHVVAILLSTAALIGSAEDDPRRVLLSLIPLPGVEITALETVPAGTFTPPEGAAAIEDLPSFCRVAATLRPTSESNIRIEVWLPRENWNGRLLGTGNGGSAGRILYNYLALGVKRGFATVNTDLGTAPAVEALTNSPERWRDFGFRATHEMTVVARQWATAFYGRPPQRAYFVGGSTGGQQGLMEAQRYPEDYDGIVAKAPANNRTHLAVSHLWNWRALNETPDSKLTAEQIAFVNRAVVAANAGKDGGAPGDDFLTDPRLAHFDLESLLREETTGASGERFSAAQIAALKKIQAGPTNPRTGEQIYTPTPLGSETEALPRSKAPLRTYILQWALGFDHDLRRFDFDRESDAVHEKLAALLNANSPDLGEFQRRGGKLLMFAGTTDGGVPFQDAVHYYERVVAAQGSLDRTQDFFRFFIVPGMSHGRGSTGPSEFGQNLRLDLPQDAEHDALLALMRWVEDGVAPERMVATAFKEGRPELGLHLQRPIFPYPKFPHYKGGDPATPSSYEGVEHERGRVTVPADRYLR